MKKLYFKVAFILILFVYGCSPCDDLQKTPCGENLVDPKIDLVVILDSSGSMIKASSAVSTSAKTAVEKALNLCSTDVRVSYFGLDGNASFGDPNSVFTQSHRDYLISINGPEIVFAADRGEVGFIREQGANGVEDVSNYFDWRDKACRAIFYISDEELDSGSVIGDFENEEAELQLAIDAAIANEVTVFTHYINHQARDEKLIEMYQRFAESTDGSFLLSDDINVPNDYYDDVIPSIICSSCRPCDLNDILGR